MTVYVDNVYIPATVGRITSKWCHLFTDQDDQTELHEMAKKIGMRRSWFQHAEDLERAPWLCHYDVTLNLRRAAVRAGAVEVTWREMADQMRQRIEARSEPIDDIIAEVDAWRTGNAS